MLRRLYTIIQGQFSGVLVEKMTSTHSSHEGANLSDDEFDFENNGEGQKLWSTEAILRYPLGVNAVVVFWRVCSDVKCKLYHKNTM